jgi:hypothetical protein
VEGACRQDRAVPKSRNEAGWRNVCRAC